MSDTEGKPRDRRDSDEVEASPEIEFKPIVELPLVEIKTLEDEEDELFISRARLYRFETGDETPEWKERGTGEVKLLKHKMTGQVRILMRRDKTLKICANHYVKANMELNKHANNEKAWMWSTVADFADEVPKAELLCIRFGNVEAATKFHEVFNEAKAFAKENHDELAQKLGKVHLSHEGDSKGDNDEGDSKEDSDDNESQSESDDSQKDDSTDKPEN